LRIDGRPIEFEYDTAGHRLKAALPESAAEISLAR
jgi:hypothetical protein